MLRRPPRPPLFPYTTLFRSLRQERRDPGAAARGLQALQGQGRGARHGKRDLSHLQRARRGALSAELRSEEHTSELQSHSDLVCRLLLEKKKKTTQRK